MSFSQQETEVITIYKLRYTCNVCYQHAKHKRSGFVIKITGRGV